MKRMVTKMFAAGALITLVAGFMLPSLARAADDGQQVFFHAPRGTSTVSVTGKNQNDVTSTWTGTADEDGNAYTQDWWFKGDVDITYVVNGQSYTKKAYISPSGSGRVDVY